MQESMVFATMIQYFKYDDDYDGEELENVFSRNEKQIQWEEFVSFFTECTLSTLLVGILKQKMVW